MPKFGQIGPKMTPKLVCFFCIPGMPKVPKIRSLHIFTVSPEKYGGLSLHAGKDKCFLQADSITLGVCSQASKVCQITSLQYLKENVKEEVIFCMQNVKSIF